MSTRISVIICTHNPRLDFLTRTLEGLRVQTLPFDKWQLLLIDNGSEIPVRSRVDLGWHPEARVVEEGRLGLTPARLRGVAEAREDLLVFVDDDNVLAPEYLQETCKIADTWPMLGAWGAGHLIPEFETTPPDWSRTLWPSIAVWSTDRDRWSNCGEVVPAGAGLCIRKTVAATYAQNAGKSGLRMALDRKGAELSSYGDHDLGLTACDLGLGTGVFAALRLTHLIPRGRLTEEYFLRLCEAQAYSHVIFRSLRNSGIRGPTWKRKLIEYIRAWRSPPLKRRFRLAELRGQARAYKTLREISLGNDRTDRQDGLNK